MHHHQDVECSAATLRVRSHFVECWMASSCCFVWCLLGRSCSGLSRQSRNSPKTTLRSTKLCKSFREGHANMRALACTKLVQLLSHCTTPFFFCWSWNVRVSLRQWRSVVTTSSRTTTVKGYKYSTHKTHALSVIQTRETREWSRRKPEELSPLVLSRIPVLLLVININ